MKLAITATPAAPRPAPLLLYGDLAAAFRQAAEAGCQGLEIHFRDAAEVDLALVKRLAAEYGLGIPTLGTGMAAADGLSFAHPDPHVRARAVDRVRGHVAFAAEVGAAVTIGILSGNLRGADLRGAALASLACVCHAAGSCGVTVLLEPLNRYECDYINTLEDGIAIIRELGAPNLKLLADSFHMNIEEADMAASLRAAAPFLGHVHLADSNRQAPGHGHLDIRAILQALDTAGYSGYLSFEVFPIPDARQAIRDGICTVLRQS